MSVTSTRVGVQIFVQTQTEALNVHVQMVTLCTPIDATVSVSTIRLSIFEKITYKKHIYRYDSHYRKHCEDEICMSLKLYDT